MVHKLTYRRRNHDNIHVRGTGGRDHHDAFRHGRAEQSRPLSTRARRHPPNSSLQRSSAEGDGALLDHNGAPQALHQRARRRHAGGPRLALDLVSATSAGKRMTYTKSQLNVLALNSGSSSLKFGLYGVGSLQIERLLSGEAESIGDKNGKFHAKDSHGKALLSESGAIPSQREALIRIRRLLDDSKMPMPAAIGHRIVHGGP